MKGKKKPADSSDVSVAGVDLSQLERLLAFMSQHGLEEFEYSQGDLRIRLKKPAANRHPRFPPSPSAPRTSKWSSRRSSARFTTPRDPGRSPLSRWATPWRSDRCCVSSRP